MAVKYIQLYEYTFLNGGTDDRGRSEEVDEKSIADAASEGYRIVSVGWEGSRMMKVVMEREVRRAPRGMMVNDA